MNAIHNAYFLGVIIFHLILVNLGMGITVAASLTGWPMSSQGGLNR